MRGLLLSPLLSLLLLAEGQATTHASNGSGTDVQAKHDAAGCVDGDTITIPAGTFSGWEATVNITKAITLQGAGIGQTFVEDDINSGSSPSSLIDMTGVTSKNSRITGIEFVVGDRTSDNTSGSVRLWGANDGTSRMRIDHCRFVNLNGFAMSTHGAIGVIDHCEVLYDVQAGICYVFDNSLGGGGYGDASWAAVDGFGTDYFIFFEDNTFTYTGGAHATGIDGYGGSRYVARYNTFTKGNFEGHGLESGQRFRSIRAVEIYNNTFIGNGGGNYPTYFRGGVFLIHDNTISGYTTNALFGMLSFRSARAYPPWSSDNVSPGGADGQNPWDVNQAGGPFATGTAASATGYTMTVSGTPWTPSAWIGYTVQRTTNLGSVTGETFSMITANTNNTLTYAASDSGALDLKWTAGDSWQFWKVTHGMDQVGRSRGSQVSGDTPSRPAGWNDQVTSPCYEWNNTRESGVDVDFGAGHPNIRSGEHYINDTAKPGYTPYTYPHPLIGDDPEPPASGGSVTFGAGAGSAAAGAGAGTVTFQ